MISIFRGVLILFVFAVCAFAACGDDDDPQKTITIAIPGSEVRLTMNWIPAGTFTMGSPVAEWMRSEDEKQRPVRIVKGFYMGIYEVTQEQYQAVMSTNPSWFATGAADGDVQEKRPVEHVTWLDAVEFCNTLSEKAGLDPVYTLINTTTNTSTGAIESGTVTQDLSKNGYRLPSEEEWEYACRAGTTTAFNCGTPEYATPDDYRAILWELGWFRGNSGSKTHEVGKKTPNAWGLYDMHGNVFEWCWDVVEWEDDDKSVLAHRVERGGSWYYDADFARSACRNDITKTERWDDLGFRLVRSLP